MNVPNVCANSEARWIHEKAKEEGKKRTRVVCMHSFTKRYLWEYTVFSHIPHLIQLSILDSDRAYARANSREVTTHGMFEFNYHYVVLPY